MKRLLPFALLVAACHSPTLAPSADASPDVAADASSTTPAWLTYGLLPDGGTPTVDKDGNPIDWHANDFPSRPTRPRSEYCLEHVAENFVRPKGVTMNELAPTSAFLRAIGKACKKNQPELADAAMRAAATSNQADRARILFRAAHVHEAWDPICEVAEIDAPKLMVEIGERFKVKDPPPYPFKHCHLEGPNWCAFDVGTWVFVRVLWTAEGYRDAPGSMPKEPEIMFEFMLHENWTDPNHQRCF